MYLEVEFFLPSRVILNMATKYSAEIDILSPKPVIKTPIKTVLVKRYQVGVKSADNRITSRLYTRKQADRIVHKAKKLGLDAYRTSPTTIRVLAS